MTLRMEGQGMERLTWKALASKLLASLAIAALLLQRRKTEPI